MTFANQSFHFLGCGLSFILQCPHIADELFVPLPFYYTLHLFWLDKMFCQPLAVVI